MCFICFVSFFVFVVVGGVSLVDLGMVVFVIMLVLVLVFILVVVVIVWEKMLKCFLFLVNMGLGIVVSCRVVKVLILNFIFLEWKDKVWN